MGGCGPYIYHGHSWVAETGLRGYVPVKACPSHFFWEKKDKYLFKELTKI